MSELTPPRCPEPAAPRRGELFRFPMVGSTVGPARVERVLRPGCLREQGERCPALLAAPAFTSGGHPCVLGLPPGPDCAFGRVPVPATLEVTGDAEMVGCGGKVRLFVPGPAVGCAVGEPDLVKFSEGAKYLAMTGLRAAGKLGVDDRCAGGELGEHSAGGSAERTRGGESVRGERRERVADFLDPPLTVLERWEFEAGACHDLCPPLVVRCCGELPAETEPAAVHPDALARLHDPGRLRIAVDCRRGQREKREPAGLPPVAGVLRQPTGVHFHGLLHRLGQVQADGVEDEPVGSTAAVRARRSGVGVETPEAWHAVRVRLAGGDRRGYSPGAFHEIVVVAGCGERVRGGEVHSSGPCCGQPPVSDPSRTPSARSRRTS